MQAKCAGKSNLSRNLHELPREIFMATYQRVPEAYDVSRWGSSYLFLCLFDGSLFEYFVILSGDEPVFLQFIELSEFCSKIELGN